MPDLHELTALPESHKEQLALSVLNALGIDNVRRQGNELIHGCRVTSYHSDQDQNPTAALNADNFMWHCLGCGAGGTILWLIATLHDEIDTIEQAREWLNGEAGLSRAMALPDLLALFDSIYLPKRLAPMPVYSPRMLTGWLEQGVPAYITGERGIDPDYARGMGICTDPVGKVNGAPTGPRAVIPHWWRGNLVGWQSRRLPEAQQTAPKYHSTPGFPRDETLYCPTPPAHPVSGDRRVLGIESPMSALRHGPRHRTAATFGAVITDLQITKLAQLPGDEFVFWLDNDEAGWRAIEGRTDRQGRRWPGAAEKLSHWKKVYVVESPWDADPAELDDDTVDTLIDAAIPWAVWARPTVLFCHKCRHLAHRGLRCEWLSHYLAPQ